jgi:hypothetical protein
MRIIKYVPKITAAKTHYREIDAEDAVWLQSQLILWLALCSELQQRRDSDSEEFIRHWWTKRNSTMPKGQHGPNSHASILAGICSAKLRDPKKNLSTPQLDVVEQMFEMIAQYYSSEPDAPQAVTFDRRLFTLA